MISLRDEKMPRITIHICHFSQTLSTKEVSPLPQEATVPERFLKELPQVTDRSDASSVVQAASTLFPPLLPRR